MEISMRRRFRFLVAPVLLSCLACSGPEVPELDTRGGAEPDARVTAAQLEDGLATITPESLLAGIGVLSADDMEGRGTGTPGEARAAEWIAGRMEEIGLEPLGGSWFQPVEMVGFAKDAAASSLQIKGPDGEIAYESEGDFTYWSSAQKQRVEISDAPIVFVGYGVEAPEVGWDDFKGLDAAGKVLLFLNNDPPVSEDEVELFGGEARTYYGRWTYKFEQAMKHGAAGAIMIHTTPSAGYGWQVIGADGQEEGFELDKAGAGTQVDLLGWAHESLAETLAATVGESLEGWFAAAASRDFLPVELPVHIDSEIHTTMRKATSRNVFGVLRGHDSELAEELVVFSAHYDHLGNEGSGEDKIFNGAWDNAAGTVSILAIAEALATAQHRSRRSIGFLACAAEEKGSLGSSTFVENPPTERSKLVANINIDMPNIFGLTRDLGAIGFEMSTLGETLLAVAEDFPVDGAPLEIFGDPNPSSGSFYRSDQVNFAKVGIPALYPQPGKDFISAPVKNESEWDELVYHQPGDEIDPEVWGLEGLVRDLRVLAMVAVNVAEASQIPRWVPGNEFEGEWQELHGE